MLETKTKFVTLDCPVADWDNFIAQQVKRNKWIPIAALRTEQYVYVTFKCGASS